MWKIISRDPRGRVRICLKRLSAGVEGQLFLNSKTMGMWFLSLRNRDIFGECWLANIPNSPEITDVLHAADEILRDFCNKTLAGLK